MEISRAAPGLRPKTAHRREAHEGYPQSAYRPDPNLFCMDGIFKKKNAGMGGKPEPGVSIR